MRKMILLTVLAASMAGNFARASEENETAGDTTVFTVVEPLMRNCKDKNLRAEDDCWTSGNTCPGPAYDTQARYCWSHANRHFYRCGLVCHSPYHGH